jgi:RND family efflux transporter MFP subunit
VLGVYVKAGQIVKKGDVLMRIDPASLQRALDQAKANLLSAQDALETAQEPTTELGRKKTKLALAQAKAAVSDAQTALDEVQNSKSATASTALSDAKLQLQQAKDKLAALQNDKATQEQIDRLQWQANLAEVAHGGLVDNPNPTDESRDRELLARNRMLDAQDSLETAKARAELDLLTAQNNVTTAEEALAKLQSGADALELARDKYNLAKAQDDLATASAGPDEKAIQLAQARYDAAKALAEEAQATLDSATMVAPFDGTVISVGVEAGDTVSAGNVAVTLADLSTLRIMTYIDESDISQVQVGQTAQITFDALTGKKFTGKVLEIPLQGTLSQNVLTYKVPVSLEGAANAGLRPGMTANLKITVGQRQNVLLVPMLAVQEADSGSVVLLKDATTGKSTQTPVELGLSDGTNSEVLAGLNEGDQVLVEYSTSSTQSSSQFGPGGGAVFFESGGGGPPPNLP